MSIAFDRGTVSRALLTARKVAFAPAKNPAPQPTAVDQAKKVVDDRLDQRGWLNDVTHGDLKVISKEVMNLQPAERSQLVAKMSDDQLKTWSSEAGSGGLFGTGGLNRDEKKDLFKDLASGLDGKQLARVANAFNGEVDAKDLGDAIAAHGTPAARVEFVKEMAGKVESDPQAAVQVAKAMGGLKGDAGSVDAALGALNDTQLSSVIKAAKQEWSYTSTTHGGATQVVTYDVAPLTAMLDAAATGGNADLKAKVFEYSAYELKGIADTSTIPGGMVVMKDGSEAKLTESLSRLITSDTNGIMKELERDFRSGVGISVFTEHMLRSGRTDEVRVIIEQLKFGNDGKGDAAQRFAATDGDGQLRNAQTLGYFVGGIHAGVSAMSRATDKQAGIIKAIFGGSLSGGKDVAGMWLSTTAKGVVGALVATVGATGVIVADQVARDIKANNKNLRQGLAELAFPKLANGENYEGAAAETAYDTAVGRVIDANKTD